MEQTRPDILEISVGNLSPGAGCTISLTYIYEAALEVAKTRLTIPTTISPKYIPFHDTSPEAKRIAAIKYDFNTPAPLSFDLEVLMKSRIENVSSPSHKVVSEGGAERNEAGFYASHTTFKATTADMDRDIVVLVQCEDPNKSVIFVEEGEESKVFIRTFNGDLKLCDRYNISGKKFILFFILISSLKFFLLFLHTF